MTASDNLHPQQFGTFFHGTRRGPFKPGDILSGGHDRTVMSTPGAPHEHVYFHADPRHASGYADTDEPSEYGTGHPAVYQVEPLDKPEMDPDLPAFTGNFRSSQARVVGQVPWGSKELPSPAYKNPHEREAKAGGKAWWQD